MDLLIDGLVESLAFVTENIKIPKFLKIILLTIMAVGFVAGIAFLVRELFAL
jgi:nitrate reductase NapE component